MGSKEQLNNNDIASSINENNANSDNAKLDETLKKGHDTLQGAHRLSDKCEKEKNKEGWKKEKYPARDEDNVLYKIYTNKKRNEVFYIPSYEGKFIYSRSGNLIGFVGDDALHFHEPSNGWPKDVKKNVGTIQNGFEGDGKVPDYSKYKTPKTKVKH